MFCVLAMASLTVFSTVSWLITADWNGFRAVTGFVVPGCSLGVTGAVVPPEVPPVVPPVLLFEPPGREPPELLPLVVSVTSRATWLD
ncbi:hypothetical protein D3C80_1735150 [compost metagenome]